MVIELIDYFAAHAPSPKLSYQEVNEILGYPDDEYGRLPTRETIVLAECVWKYRWAQNMLKAKLFVAKNAAGK